MQFTWVKRWSFCEKYYCEDFVISKILSPHEGWHLEKLLPNGDSKHYGTYSQFEYAQHVAEAELKLRMR